VIIGCAAVPKKPPEPTVPPASPVVKDPFSVFPERYRSKAMEYEKNGELRRALQSWEIVNRFIPTDQEVANKIDDLKAQIHTLADQHFKKGLSYYQSNSIQAAVRKEFLIALHYDPDHQEALNYVRQKLEGEDYTLYQIKRGDTFKEIAKKTFNDPNKDFLIAYFNDLKMDAKLVPGNTLKLPILELTRARSAMETKEPTSGVSEVAADTQEMLSKALAFYKAKKYRDTLSISEKILEYDPANREARDLINESYYQMGKLFIQGKKYQEALEIFNRVDSGYKDVSESITYAKKQIAGEHYLRGVKYYTEEDLDKAIKEWEATLALDPNHPKAKKDIENARSLLQKLKEIK
jgi:tetratricopeptide (TPR) repeat protein